jgi:hypothetical protein
MRNAVARILALAAAFLVLAMTISLVGSVAQVAAAADRVYAGLGQAVFWILLTLLVTLLVAPVVLYFRLPRALIAPAETSGPEHDEYMRKLKIQLARNPYIAGMPLDSDEDLAAAIGRLDREANIVVRNTASAIFAGTAVMQNGRLDALVVLASQVRMTWRIATIYYQRPSARQMLYVYGNVGANVLVADNLRDVDFSGIVTPIVTGIFPSLKGAVPGLQGISVLLVNSIANGAANAFLTLRVGIITREYCAAPHEAGEGRGAAQRHARRAHARGRDREGAGHARRAGGVGWRERRGAVHGAGDDARGAKCVYFPRQGWNQSAGLAGWTRSRRRSSPRSAR